MTASGVKWGMPKKQDVPLRIFIQGWSKTGKSYTALSIATALVGKDASKIAVFDTENGALGAYEGMFEFSVYPKQQLYPVTSFAKFLNSAAQDGFQVAIIDSLTKQWVDGILGEHGAIATAKFRGNTLAAWSVSGKRHETFIDQILTSPLPVIICTAQLKNDWDMDSSQKLEPIANQRSSTPYRFSVIMEADKDTSTTPYTYQTSIIGTWHKELEGKTFVNATVEDYQFLREYVNAS